MKIVIYPLLQTTKGKVPGEFEVAEVVLEGQEVRINCPDGALRERISQIFSTPICVRRPAGEIPRVFAHGFKTIECGSAEFFQEIPFHLRKYNLYGVLVPGK